MTPRPEIPRTVKQRRGKNVHLHVIAVTRSELLVERTGQILPRSELPMLVETEPASLFVTPNAAAMLHELDAHFDALPQWQFRVTPVTRELVKPNGEVTGRQVVTTTVSMFGFRAPEGSKKRGRYHQCLDPWVFSRWDGIHALTPDDGQPELLKLLSWGMDLRAWCELHDLRLSASAGGLANQLLKDRRFWPDARRKVPAHTNAVARHALPGNCYRLYADTGTPYTATYLDMSSAHHNLATGITFPDPDDLYQSGRWPRGTDGTDGTDPQTDRRPWVRFGTPKWNRLAECHGLLYLRLSVPRIPATRFPPPYAERPGTVYAYVFTNELPMLRELGIAIDWAVNAWVARKTTDGLNRYASFALEQIRDADAARRLWLKGALLAPYGMLAAKPRTQEFGYKRAKGGEVKQYPAGPGLLTVKARTSLRPREAPVANVIYRGMIEAETRMRSLSMARDLHGRGARVLAVYADSVFVESHVALPLLPSPWRVEAYLDRLRFMSPTAFTSVQMTKLPGIPRDKRDLLAPIEDMRRSVRGI